MADGLSKRTSKKKGENNTHCVAAAAAAAAAMTAKTLKEDKTLFFPFSCLCPSKKDHSFDRKTKYK